MYQPLAIQHDERKTIIMNSKIRIEHDFEHSESYIALNLEDGDTNDKALKNFVEHANNRGLELTYPRANQDNKTIYIRPSKAQDTELFIVKQFRSLCEESLSKEQFKEFEGIYSHLFQTRSSLIGKEDLIY